MRARSERKPTYQEEGPTANSGVQHTGEKVIKWEGGGGGVERNINYINLKILDSFLLPKIRNYPLRSKDK